MAIHSKEQYYTFDHINFPLTKVNRERERVKEDISIHFDMFQNLYSSSTI